MPRIKQLLKVDTSIDFGKDFSAREIGVVATTLIKNKPQDTEINRCIVETVNALRETLTDGLGDELEDFCIGSISINRGTLTFTPDTNLESQIGTEIQVTQGALKQILGKLTYSLRQSTTLREKIIQQIIIHQADFLKSGDLNDLQAMGQEELARSIGSDQTTISRSLNTCRIKLPTGRSIPVSKLVPSPRTLLGIKITLALSEITERSAMRHADGRWKIERINAILKDDFNIKIEERTLRRYLSA